jgi:hypothetical protein
MIEVCMHVFWGALYKLSLQHPYMYKIIALQCSIDKTMSVILFEHCLLNHVFAVYHMHWKTIIFPVILFVFQHC